MLVEKNYLHSPEQYPAFSFKYWSWNWQFYSRHFEALESNISALVCRVHILHNKNSFLKVSEISVFWRFSENCGTQIIVSIIGTSEKNYLFQIEQSRLRQSDRLNDIQASSSFTETILNYQNKEQWSWRSRNETQQLSDFFTLWYTVWQACMTWITNITTGYREFLFLKTVSTLSTFLKFDLFCFHIVSDQLIFWRVGAIQKKPCLLLKKVRLR